MCEDVLVVSPNIPVECVHSVPLPDSILLIIAGLVVLAVLRFRM